MGVEQAKVGVQLAPVVPRQLRADRVHRDIQRPPVCLRVQDRLRLVTGGNDRSQLNKRQSACWLPGVMLIACGLAVQAAGHKQLVKSCIRAA